MFGSHDETLSIGVTLDTQDVDSQLAGLDRAFNAGLGAGQAFIGTLVAIDAAILGLGVAASKKAAEFEALTLSLNAVEGSASKARKAIEELRDIAKGPGLGVESAIQTYAGLRRGGLDSAFSMDLTRNLGNAIAYTGGGKEELGRIAVALNQIATSQFLRGQDVMQLNEARIPIYKILKDAFGTAETEDLKKLGVSSAEALHAINEELAKLPKVTGGAKNTFENIADTIDYGMVQIGTGINNVLMPAINDLLSSFGDLTKDSTLTQFGELLGQTFLDMFDSIKSAATTSQDVLDQALMGILATSFATRNFVMNLEDLKDILPDLMSQILRSIPGIGPLFDTVIKLIPRGAQGVGITSPFDEALEAMKGIQAERKGREAFNARQKKGEDATAEEPPKPEESKPQTVYLREIARNTKTMADRLSDAIMGGGTTTDRYFNSRNIAHLSGEHATGGFKLIIQGIQQVMAEQMVQGARAGNWRRSS